MFAQACIVTLLKIFASSLIIINPPHPPPPTNTFSDENFSQVRVTVTDVCTDFIFSQSNFFAYIQLNTRLAWGTVGITAQRDYIGVIIMFSETFHTMMSLRSIAGEIGLYLLVKMYLAVNK
jgi:hypothetical protein